LPDDDIATAQILEVVGEGTKGSKDGIRVPTGLELDALPFHPSLVKQIADVGGSLLLTVGSEMDKRCSNYRLISIQSEFASVQAILPRFFDLLDLIDIHVVWEDLEDVKA